MPKDGERVSRDVISTAVVGVLRKRSSLAKAKTMKITDGTLLTGDLGFMAESKAALAGDVDAISQKYDGRHIRPGETEKLILVGTLITLTYTKANS